MEKGYYSIAHLKAMILDKDKIYYYLDYDPYNNYMEIEFTIDEMNADTMVVICRRFFTSWLDKVVRLEHPTTFRIKNKDFEKVKTKSIYL
jgi:hypothetical protein